MRAYHAVGGWISCAAACGLTLFSTGCHSSGGSWSNARSWNPFYWGSSTTAADPRGGPQLPTANSQPAYPRTSQTGLPQAPNSGAPGSAYATGPYSMSGNNPAGGAPPVVTGPAPSGPAASGSSAGPGNVAGPTTPGANPGFYNENAYGPPNGSPSPTQPAQYTADARNQFGPAAPATFESQQAPPSNPGWPNAQPPAGAPNPGFETAPPAGTPAWPNGPVNAAPPAWPGAGATNVPAETGPAMNPAAPPAGAPGFSENTSTPRFAPQGGFPAAPPAPAPTAPPPTMTYLGDSPPPSMMGAVPAPVAPPGGSTAPQHRADPMYRPGTTKDYLPGSTGAVQPAGFERAAPSGWPNP